MTVMRRRMAVMVKMRVVVGVMLLLMAMDTVSISWGFCHKVPHTGGLTNRNSWSHGLRKPQLKALAKLGPSGSRRKIGCVSLS